MNENGSGSGNVWAHESEGEDRQGKGAMKGMHWAESASASAGGAKRMVVLVENGNVSVCFGCQALHDCGYHSMRESVHANANVPVKASATVMPPMRQKLHDDDVHPWRTSRKDLLPVPTCLRVGVAQYASRVDPDFINRRLYERPINQRGDVHALNCLKHDEDRYQDEKNSIRKSR